LGLAATMEKCNPKKNNNKDMNKWLNDYMLFKLQNVKLDNAIDLKSAVNGILYKHTVKLHRFLI
jgi:hypothetical protein